MAERRAYSYNDDVESSSVNQSQQQQYINYQPIQPSVFIPAESIAPILTQESKGSTQIHFSQIPFVSGFMLINPESHEYWYSEYYKKNKKRIQKVIGYAVTGGLIFLGVLALITMYWFAPKACVPSSKTMCKIDTQDERNFFVNSESREYAYDYIRSLDYSRFCNDTEDLVHNMVSVWKINGTLKYFINEDEHDSVNGSNAITKGIQDRVSWINGIVNDLIKLRDSYASNNHAIQGKMEEIDSICSFEMSHVEIRNWVYGLVNSKSVGFDLSRSELRNDIIHTRLLLIDGIWDVSKISLLDKMRIMIDSGSKSCVCAQDLGIYKNIIMVKSEDGQHKVLINPSIFERSSENIKILQGTFYYIINQYTVIPYSVSVRYLDEYNREKINKFEKEDSACVLMCTNDSVFVKN